MDGLMFNTEDLFDEVGKIALARRGHNFTRELKLKMMGRHAIDALQIMVDEFNLESTAEELLTETDEIIEEVFPKNIEMMPGLEKLINHLEALKIPKAVATSSRRRNVNYGFDKFNLHESFHFVLTAETTTNSKPDPEIYLTAAECFEIKPEEMMVLEDSPLGSQAGASAGAFTVAVPTIYTTDQDFSHVDLVATSLEDEQIYDLF